MKTPIYDQSGFMTIDHPDAHKGMQKKAKPSEYHSDWTHECPSCRGYGGHHLRVDAYGIGKHFDCSCFHCAGWGWTTEADAKCVHDFANQLSYDECRERGIYHAGRCWHVYECTKCGAIRSADSSD